MLAYRVREHNKISQTIKNRGKKKNTKKQEKKKKIKRKQKQDKRQVSEECDARRSERKGCKKNSMPAEEEHMLTFNYYVLADGAIKMYYVQWVPRLKSTLVTSFATLKAIYFPLLIRGFLS